MRHPAVRWTVLAIAVIAAAGCCYWAARLEQRALDKRRAVAVATIDARGLQSALADTRRALSAMASPGQAAVSWSRQATASLETARGRLAALLATDGGAGLRQHAERLDKLADAEARLRENAVSGRALMASDVAFGEALPHVDALDHEVAETIGTMIATADRDLASTRDQQILALASALGVLGVAAVLLTPAPRRRGDEAAVGAPAEAEEPLADGLPMSMAAATAAPAVAIAGTAAPWATPGAPAAPPPPTVALTPLAAACDALARLADGDKLPGVLDSVRPALGARGIAVWLADADHKTLQVVASSGYDRRVVERFFVVSVTDDNPTAKAFARVRSVTTPSRAGEPAAIALPIAGARGTTGVLSLEMTGTREAGSDVLAAAGIVASQLATLLEPLPKSAAEAAVEPGADDTPAGRVELG
ncbi:MAG: GAF domain-containing protein [Acidobacteria bacterium]|nr:GAF domain-containing protein [Acidobacteriota bacterium]